MVHSLPWSVGPRSRPCSDSPKICTGLPIASKLREHLNRRKKAVHPGDAPTRRSQFTEDCEFRQTGRLRSSGKPLGFSAAICDGWRRLFSRQPVRKSPATRGIFPCSLQIVSRINGDNPFSVFPIRRWAEPGPLVFQFDSHLLPVCNCPCR